MRRFLLAAVALALASPALASGASFDPVYEAKNFSKTTERQSIYLTPQYQLLLRKVSVDNRVYATSAQAKDTEREFADLCGQGDDGCAGDVRLYDWQAKGYGIVSPVLFTARSGATLSGHVWATKSGPAKRPGIVITNGSVQADEQQSDTFGEGTDQQEGFPAQSDGRPFFDGTVDALDFFLSTPAKPFAPRRSCNSGTSHQAKQVRRVKAGLDTAYNPFVSLLEASRIGLAGHSYGAAGVSYVAQADPRVKAVVAWDNLAPAVVSKANGSFPPGAASCVDASQRRPVKITKPGLGLSADYFLPPTPNISLPVRTAKSTSSLAYSKAGVDTGEIIIRGGSHYDFDWIPDPGFGASLRGADLITWYTTAWFDKYVKGDRTADARLLTDRWRVDGATAAVDPDHDGNVFSSYYDSRLSIRSVGRRITCESLRSACSALSSRDGYAGSYDFLSVDTSPDGRATAQLPSAKGLRG